MNLLFCLLWGSNFLLLIIAIAGGGFRGEMNLSTDLNTWTALLLVITTISSLVLRFVFKRALWSLGIVAAPIILAILLYFIDKSKNKMV